MNDCAGFRRAEERYLFFSSLLVLRFFERPFLFCCFVFYLMMPFATPLLKIPALMQEAGKSVRVSGSMISIHMADNLSINLRIYIFFFWLMKWNLILTTFRVSEKQRETEEINWFIQNVKERGNFALCLLVCRQRHFIINSRRIALFSICMSWFEN